MSLAGGTRLGPYEILGLIGAGGMGEVYRARDTRLDRDVAIKVLPDEVATDADRLRRFEREARAIAALSHPNILAVYDVGLSPVAYVVTELLEGQTLRQRLARGALPVRKALDYGRQIADGLAAAHDHGIVHRDIKPDNLFLTRDERVKLLDFGLARQEASGAGALAGAGASGSDDAAAGQASTMTVLTDPHAAVGTVGYMAPEQVRAQAVDHRADLFAFGATLYEMLTGRRAFAGATPPDTLSAILSQDPPPLIAPDGAALPPAIERIVIRCLEKDPAARFQSTRDLAFALKTLTPPSSSSSATAPPTVAARRSWRRLMLTIALAGAVLGGVGLSFLASRRTAPEGARLTYERLTFRQGPIVSARFGPDGKTVFYGAAWEGSPFRIYQTRPEGGELALPIENADLLSVSRDGQLAVLLLKRFGPNAWWKTGTLAVVPVLGAAAHELAEDVRAADWAPDGRTLAVVREVGGVSRLEFPLGQVQYERSRGYIFFPRVSPSGARVAFFEGDVLGGFTVSVVDGSGHRTVLSEGWADSWDIVWSPDGHEVWFAGTKPCAGNQGTLFAVDMQGRRRVLAGAPGTLDIHDVTRDGRALAGKVSVGHGTRAWGPDGLAERNLSWLEYSWPADLSPDGRLVLLNVMSKCTAGSEASYASFLRPVDGAAPVRVADNLVDGRFSPHQRSLLFSEPRRIRVLPIGAGTPHTLDLSFATPTALGAQGWMPDGDRIVVAAVEGAGKMTLRVLAARTGQQQSASVAFVPDVGALISNWLSPVSPDGRVVAVKAGDGRVLVVPLDGSAPHPVPNSDANELPVQWSDDSRSLFVFRPGEVPTRVFRVEVSTGQRTLWREIRPPDVSATGVGGLYLTRDGRSGVYGYAHALVDLYIVNGLR